MKSALIVDDHPVVRGAVKLVLEREGFKTVYEASSVGDALSVLRMHAVDLVTLDLVMPGCNGLDLLDRIKSNDWACSVLVFTSLDALFFQERCMRAGALAYVSKTNDLQQLRKAVQAVTTGYSYFEQLTCGFIGTVQQSEKQMIDKLSNRELTILQYLARGEKNTMIAELMHLSHKTVSTYKTRLIEKLGVKSAVHLRDFAIRNHLI